MRFATASTHRLSYGADTAIVKPIVVPFPRRSLHGLPSGIPLGVGKGNRRRATEAATTQNVISELNAGARWVIVPTGCRRRFTDSLRVSTRQMNSPRKLTISPVRNCLSVISLTACIGTPTEERCLTVPMPSVTERLRCWIQQRPPRNRLARSSEISSGT